MQKVRKETRKVIKQMNVHIGLKSGGSERQIGKTIKDRDG